MLSIDHDLLAGSLCDGVEARRIRRRVEQSLVDSEVALAAGPLRAWLRRQDGRPGGRSPEAGPDR